MKGMIFSPVVSHLTIPPFVVASKKWCFFTHSPSFGSQVHAADFLTNPFFVKSSMTSKVFLVAKNWGKGSDGQWSDNLLCFLRFGSGAIYRCEGWLFLGGGLRGFSSELVVPGDLLISDGRQGWKMRMWHHLICGSKICCGFSWIYWSTVYSGIYCGFSRLNSPVVIDKFVSDITRQFMNDRKFRTMFPTKAPKTPTKFTKPPLGMGFQYLSMKQTEKSTGWLGVNSFHGFWWKNFAGNDCRVILPRMLTPDYRDLLFLEQHGSQP